MMSLKQIFKKVLIPCAAGLTADGHSHGPNCVKRAEESRPSSLPLYSNECSVCGRSQKKDEPPTQMEEAVGSIRKELWVWQDNVRGYRHKFVDVYRDSFQQVDSVLQYLREESHGPQRAGAVAMSGLAGYIWGMRHCSLIRRLFCTTCGALSMAALCYPKESAHYFETFVHDGKKYFLVAYHFVMGDPDEAQLENMSSTSLGRLTLKTLAWNRENLKRQCHCKLDPSDPKPCAMTLDGKADQEKKFVLVRFWDRTQ